MYVRGVTISGFADLTAFRAVELGRVVRILGPGPAATAVGDGLSLGFAALSEPGLRALLQRWAIVQPDEEIDIETSPLPIQATWSDRQMAQALVAETSVRRLQVALELVLDPPMFGRLRSLGAREPRLVTALGDDPVVKLGVSAYFGASWDVLSIGVQSFVVGEESFPTSSQERPRWLTDFLAEAGDRFWHHTPELRIADAAMAAMTSLDGDEHAGFVAWQAALESEFGPVRPARGHADKPVLLAQDLPIRRYGRYATDRTVMAASVFLSGADVLWAGYTDDWIEHFVEGENSPLEQVWRVDPTATLDPSAVVEDAPRSVLAFSGGLEEE